MKSTYQGGSAQLKAKFLSRLKILAHLPKSEWHDTYHKHLVGPCAGLAEIRFKADKVQQRPLGYHSGEGEFVILLWATEKGGKFVPLSACERALARKKEALSNKGLVHALWLELE